MEFWGVEVKPGKPVKVHPGDHKILHLSQASLGEAKKVEGNDTIIVFVNVDGQKLVLGTLSSKKCLQITYDLIFEKEFELSHNWKNGSVYFCGYKSVLSDGYPSDSDDSDIGEDIPLVMGNGKPEPTAENMAKAGTSEAKSKVKIVEPKKDEKSKKDEPEDDDEDSEDDDLEDASGDDDDESDDEEINAASDDSNDDEDDSSDEEDEDDDTPKKKFEQSKKRPAESAASKTPAEKKKAKLVTPQKTGTDGKKGSGVHIATPHPAKRTSGNNDKSKQQILKSASSQVSCSICSKTFNSEKGLESHTKAKHSASK